METLTATLAERYHEQRTQEMWDTLWRDLARQAWAWAQEETEEN